MSTLKVNAIRQTAASSDAITLASDGTCTAKITNNLSNRNLINNGAMIINQRSHSGAITDGNYSLDRYRLNITSAGAWSITQADLGTAGPTGFRNSLKLDCTTANASLSTGSVLHLHQKFEAQDLQQLAYGSSGAKSVTISFWIKSNKTGTFPLDLYCTDPSTNRQHVKLYTISSADTWEKKTLTFAGDTGGQINNDTGTGMTLGWYLAAGTDYTSGSNDPQWVNQDNTERAAGLTVNLADSTSNYVEITGVQLEISDHATEFEHLPYGVELARCKRYYQQLKGANLSFRNSLIGSFNTATGIVFMRQLEIEMRANPTVEILSTDVAYPGLTLSDYDIEPFDDAPTALSVRHTRKWEIVLNCTSPTSRTVGFMGVLALHNADALITISADL